jgi:hypothetical protein
LHQICQIQTQSTGMTPPYLNILQDRTPSCQESSSPHHPYHTI